MEGPGFKYVAVRDIPAPGADPGVFAYRAGHLVHEDAVSGPDAWLRAGADVEPRPGVELDRPAKTASRAVWAAYLVSTGADERVVEELSRAELIALADKAVEPPAKTAKG